jgi:hypothetical protein
MEPESILSEVARVLRDVGIPYHLGGSFASAYHGIARATMDADIVVDLHAHQVDVLVDRLGSMYYADEASILEAVRRRASVNLLHLPTMFKIDLFMLRDRGWDRTALARAETVQLRSDDPTNIAISTAEDVILAKLEWYRKGGGVSDRQWRDVLGVIQVQSNRLDFEYLERAATEIGVADLLHRAREHAMGA